MGLLTVTVTRRDIDDRNCATGELYDAFTLEKRDGESIRLREALPPENPSPMTAP